MFENKFVAALRLSASPVTTLQDRGRVSFRAFIAEDDFDMTRRLLLALPVEYHAVVVTELIAIGNDRSQQILAGLFEIRDLTGLSFIAVAPIGHRPSIELLTARLPAKSRPTDWNTQLPLARVIASYGELAVGPLCRAECWSIEAGNAVPGLIASAAGANPSLIVNDIHGGVGLKNELSNGGKALLTYSDEGLAVLTEALANTQGDQQSAVIVTLGRMKANASTAADLLLAFIRQNMASTIGEVRENVTQAAFSLADSIRNGAAVPAGTMDVIWDLLCTPILGNDVWNPLDLATSQVFAAIGTEALPYVERGAIHDNPTVRCGAIHALSYMARRVATRKALLPGSIKMIAAITAVVSKLGPLFDDPDDHVRTLFGQELNEILWHFAEKLEDKLLAASWVERTWRAAQYAAALRLREGGTQRFENHLVKLLSMDGNSAAIANLLGNYAQTTHAKQGGANSLLRQAWWRVPPDSSKLERLIGLLSSTDDNVVEAVCSVLLALSKTQVSTAREQLSSLLDRGERSAAAAQAVFEGVLCT